MQLIGCENMRGIPFCIPLFLRPIFPGIMPSICANCQKATPIPKPRYFSPQINMRVEMPMASEQYEFIDIWKVGECHGIASNGLNNSLWRAAYVISGPHTPVSLPLYLSARIQKNISGTSIPESKTKTGGEDMNDIDHLAVCGSIAIQLVQIQ